MVEFKLTIGDPKTGKCYQRTVSENDAKSFIGLKIGNTIKGESIDLTGYEFQITGGSDFCGFPMRKGIAGARKRILVEKGVGFRGGKKGIRRRKTVCGEAINEKISQINLKILKHGKAKLEAAEKKEGKEEKPKKAPKEEKKETQKPKEKPKEAPKKEEAPKEEAKAEAPKEASLTQTKSDSTQEEKPKEEK
ncbi:30S ribosomal protein S6e [Candidatus Woesearchaeota archaeon]|nr:30S ribosomal protein S6e [Candidatus Woesearchaeota archaeon]